MNDHRQLLAGVDESTEALLNKLIDPKTEAKSYQHAMYELGLRQGRIIAEKAKGLRIGVVCTVEDADFLAKGVLDGLHSVQNSPISLACFWNKRISGDEYYGRSAPILKKYKEPGVTKADVLVVVKSIISGACVVKTNLTSLIQEANPKQIFLVAPVMYKDAQKKLELEFPKSISSKFDYICFAIDDLREPDGTVVPGIGGDVYSRLGFGSQDQKNKVVPQIVIDRRADFKLQAVTA